MRHASGWYGLWSARNASRAPASLAVLVTLAALWGCNPPPPASPPSITHPQPVPPAATVSGMPKAIQLGKPPLLGPLGPPIVVLPDRIAEPEIRVRLTEEQAAQPVIAKNQYRGRIDIFRMPSGKYVAVNVLPLESYLQGVLKGELYDAWDPAAYRAQAIAARTYALFQIYTGGRTKAWDVSNDTSSQKYGGILSETDKSRAAVAATGGQVLTATVNGATGIFCSLYSACIGGASQDPFDAWGDPPVGPLAAHLTGNVDDNSPRYNWDRDFVVTKADLTRCIQNWGLKNSFPYLQALGADGGRIDSVEINRRNPVTNRPVEFMLRDSANRAAPIRAEEFRLALLNDPAGKAPKPYSSNFDIRAENDAFVLYNGHGYGHGIGMSQWGAQKLATQGRTHIQILAFFYPGAGLKQMW